MLKIKGLSSFSRIF